MLWLVYACVCLCTIAVVAWELTNATLQCIIANGMHVVCLFWSLFFSYTMPFSNHCGLFPSCREKEIWKILQFVFSGETIKYHIAWEIPNACSIPQVEDYSRNVASEHTNMNHPINAAACQSIRSIQCRATFLWRIFQEF